MIRFIDTSVEELSKIINDIVPVYSDEKNRIREFVKTITRMALTKFAKSDSLYFSLEHTFLCSEIALELLQCLVATKGVVRPGQVINIMTAVLFCNVGIIRGILPQDKINRYAITKNDVTNIQTGATDSALWKYRTSRSAMYIENTPYLQNTINNDIVISAINCTDIFKLTDKNRSYTDIDLYCRATQVIGLMSSPNYQKQLVRLYWSAVEGGILDTFSFKSLGEFRKDFSDYFWDNLYADVAEIILLLRETDKGREIVSSMYSQL